MVPHGARKRAPFFFAEALVRQKKSAGLARALCPVVPGFGQLVFTADHDALALPHLAVPLIAFGPAALPT